MTDTRIAGKVQTHAHTSRVMTVISLSARVSATA
jgi:hypothetical protein